MKTMWLYAFEALALAKSDNNTRRVKSTKTGTRSKVKHPDARS